MKNEMLNYSYMKKEQKSTTKVPSAKSLKLDEEIKRLLFLNPLMDFKIIKRTIDSLPSLMIKEKEQWVKVLKNRRNEFVIETANTSNTATRDSVIEHISSWENEYGRIPLQGIVDLLHDTEYQIFAPTSTCPNPTSWLLDRRGWGRLSAHRNSPNCLVSNWEW